METESHIQVSSYNFSITCAGVVKGRAVYDPKTFLAFCGFPFASLIVFLTSMPNSSLPLKRIVGVARLNMNDDGSSQPT